MNRGGSSVIEVRDLRKTYDDHHAVEGLTFAVPAGRVTGFLGPNGAGKSTTLRMILGLVSVSGGTATVSTSGFTTLENPMHAVGALLDTHQFDPRRTGRNHLKILAAAAGVGLERVDQVLKEVELERAGRKKVGTYSLGMRQRLGLAAALLGDPEILILDEPGNGLDPAGLRWLRSLLRAYAARGRTVFVSSHLLDEVAQIADEVVVIHEGRLITHAAVAELTAKTTAELRISSTEPERLAAALTAASVDAEQVSANEVIARTDPLQVWAIATEHATPITGLREEERKLEDIFLELTSRTEV